MSLLGWRGSADAVSWIAGDDSGVGADVQVAAALTSVGVVGRRIVLALMLGQPLLVAEGSSYRIAVVVSVRFL